MIILYIKSKTLEERNRYHVLWKDIICKDLSIRFIIYKIISARVSSMDDILWKTRYQGFIIIPKKYFINTTVQGTPYIFRKKCKHQNFISLKTILKLKGGRQKHLSSKGGTPLVCFLNSRKWQLFFGFLKMNLQSQYPWLVPSVETIHSWRPL